MLRTVFAVVLALASACSENPADAPSGSGQRSTEGSESPASGGKSSGSPSGEADSSGSGAAASGLGHALAESDRALVVEADKTTYEADYADDAVLIAGDAIAALSQADDKAHRYTFDAAKLKARGVRLERGKVLLIAGRALRKISKIAERNGQLVVETEYASLNQAIANGRIGTKATLPLETKHVVAMVLPDGREIPVQRRGEWLYASAAASAALPVASSAQPQLDWSLKDGTLEYKAKLVPQQDKIDLLIQITRKMQPAGSLIYKAKGTIRPIKVDASAEFENGTTKRFEYGQDDVGGEFELSVTAAGGGKVEISKDVPALMLKWIVMIGPVPLVITAKAKIIGRIDLPPKGSSTFGSKFQFRGKGGMTLVGTSVDAKIGFASENFTPKPLDAAAMIGQPVDVQFGVAFPMVSAGFFDSFVVPNFFTGATLGARLRWGPVCKSGYLKFTAHYGYDFKVLGVDMASFKKKFYEKQRTADQNGCSKKHGD